MTPDESKIKFGRVIARSWSDDAYKARLIDTPRAVFQEAGLEVPDDIHITVVEQTTEAAEGGNLSVVEQTGKQFVLNLPRPPADVADVELDEKRLAEVAGGSCTWCFTCW